MNFSERMRTEIKTRVESKLLSESSDTFRVSADVEAAIDTFIEFCLIEDKEILFGSSIVEAIERDFLYTGGWRIFHLEAFFKKLLRIVSMAKWNERDSEDWTMSPLYGYFGVYQRFDPYKNDSRFQSANGFVLSECEPELFHGEGQLREEYCRCRLLRNLDGHGLATYQGLEILPYDENIMRSSILCVLLDMCGTHRDKIHKKYAEQIALKSFDVLHYATELVEGYQDRENKYLRVQWKATNVAGDIATYNIIDLINKTDTNRLVKLIGCAGVGKTESVRYATYFRAKNILKNEGRGKLPIYLPLIHIQETETTIEQMVADALHLSIENATCVIESRPCVFFMDGYNEILDIERRKKAATEILKMIKKFPKAQFVIGDRSTKTNPPCAVEAVCYELVPLGKEQIKEFFKRNTCVSDTNEPDEETLEIILNEYDDKLKWIENTSVTPYMLKVLIEMMQEQKAAGEEINIPQSELTFFNRELQFKLKREYEKKLDYRIPALKECLKELSVKLADGAHMDISVIQHSFRESGIGLEEAMHYIELCTGLDVLVQDDDDAIAWSRKEYSAYFRREYQKRFL